ncbi:MAG: hypothetical protein H8D80_01730 [Proteobacteria bacterium]|nr:hypothetical protein [Pseudomonadota bacterium]
MKRMKTEELQSLMESVSNRYGELDEQLLKRKEEEEKFKTMAQSVVDTLNQQTPQIPSPGEGVQDPYQMGEITPLETGAPGAMSMDIGLDTLARAAERRPMEQMPPMDMPMQQMPPMDMPMDMPMQQMPPMDMERPSFDSLPGMPSAPPKMGGPDTQVPPAPEQQEMKPSDDFGDRFNIPSELPRHYLRSTSPAMPPAPSMPPTQGPESAERGPQQGTQVPSSLRDQPSAPKETGQPELQPGQTVDSQKFIDTYADAIRVQLKSIIDNEKEKYAGGQFMTQNIKESIGVSVMPTSPVAPNEARASIDAHLGMGNVQKRWNNNRENWLKYWK